MKFTTDRHAFISYFATLGFSSALFPGVLWAELYGKGAHATDNHPAPTLTKDMLRQAATIAALEFTDKELDTMLEGTKGNLRTSCSVALPQTALAISLPRLRPML